MRRNSQPVSRRWGHVLLALALGGAVAADAAEKPSPTLEQVEAQIAREREKRKELEEESRKLALETAALRRKLIEAARGAQEKEGLLTHLEEQLENLVEDAKQREIALADQRRQLAGTLGALARLSRNTPQAIMFSPGRPTDMIHSALLLRVAVPRLGKRAEELSSEVETLKLVKRDIAGKLLSLRKTDDELVNERARLRRLLDRKTMLRQQTDEAYQQNDRRMAALADQARNIRELMARLQTRDSEPLPRPPSRPATATPLRPATVSPDRNVKPKEPEVPVGLRRFPENGPVTLPVSGRIVGQYGESLDFGNTARGIRLETRASAQVVAPFDGKIVFAGPFRNYGQILIIEHRGGYHTLLAGLGRIDSLAGQWVLAGEPVGAMGTRKSGLPSLYLELRRNGQPINPLPWIAAGKQKVRG